MIINSATLSLDENSSQSKELQGRCRINGFYASCFDDSCLLLSHEICIEQCIKTSLKLKYHLDGGPDMMSGFFFLLWK